MPCSHHRVSRSVSNSRCLYCVLYEYYIFIIMNSYLLIPWHMNSWRAPSPFGVGGEQGGRCFLRPGTQCFSRTTLFPLGLSSFSEFLILSFFAPLPLNLPLKHDLFFPPSLPFFFHNFERVILVSRFAFSSSWNLLCALFELFHSSSELYTIPPLLFPRVRLPWCFSLFPKDSGCFLKNFARIKWHLQKSIKWCLKSLQRKNFLPHSF